MPGGELTGRRLWFVGICGDGMNALALLAAGLGAEVGGSDLRESRFTPALRAAGIDVRIGPQRAENVPDGAEAVFSSAVPRDNPEVIAASRAFHRGELLAEIVSLRPSIVVGGTHGKTTTGAMIAYCLQELGLDPALVLGTEVPQLAGSARAGDGWLVTEGDEHDRSVALLRPTIAVLTNVDFDHHVAFGSLAEVREFFEGWLAGAEQVVRGDELEPLDVELGVPGEHNRANAAAAVAALELAGVSRADSLRVIGGYRGAGHRFELHGTEGDVEVISDYGHHPAEVAVTISTAHELAGAGRVLVVFRPLRYSRTRHLARELAAALARADVVAVADVNGSSESRLDGVSGKLVVDELTELRPGMPLAWTPDLADAAKFIAGRARSGDVVLAQGADDVIEAVRPVLETLSARKPR
ncbi:MAG TPA: Mur ligase domain-containing protein [Gaiellaceae bacterium]|nr:Mur ligase domain-containing protein [Gaiellaceae bacterium]